MFVQKRVLYLFCTHALRVICSWFNGYGSIVRGK